MRFAHTNIIAHDWKRLADFYVKVFACRLKPPPRSQSGLWLERGTGVKAAALEGVHLLLPGHGEDGPTLEIYSYADTLEDGPAVPNRRGLGHLAFEVDDVAAVLPVLQEHGGSLLGELTTNPVEGVGLLTFVYTRDPEGNVIELQSWKTDTGGSGEAR